MNTAFLKNFKYDIPASIVVFFVALPLCMGIALASGAPPFAGLIAGIVGGIIVGSISGSQIGVSGPAAGLAAIVMSAITDLGSYENFLLAVVLGGVIQIAFGIAKAGVIGYYFPSSVIKGMLVGIGIIIIIKQIPHFFGYTATDNNFSIANINNGATIIGILSIVLMLFWSSVLSKKGKFFTIIQGPFAAVVLGVLFYITTKSNDVLSISDNLLVKVPVPKDIASFKAQFSTPNFDIITDKNIWITAFTIALVASLETLLCVEATDKIDPQKRVTPTNRELFAQGTGNIISGMIGGLPITQVIVRSSANIQSGGKTKLSAIVHGILLLISVILIPTVLNLIPLSVLAAVLLIVGYKLANPAIFRKIFGLGWQQYIPFILTVLVVQYNLLYGIGLGLVTGIFIVLYKSYKNSHFLHRDDTSSRPNVIKMEFAEEVTFFNKGAIIRELNKLPENTILEIGLLKTRYLDNDIIEVLEDFLTHAKTKNITIKLTSKRGVEENIKSFVDFFNSRPKSKLSLK